MSNKQSSVRKPAWWTSQVLALLLALAMLFMQAPVVQAVKDDPPKAHSGLLQWAKDHPDDTIRVIIQKDRTKKDEADDEPEVALQKGGGKFSKKLGLINGFSGEITGKQLEKLAKNKKLKWISLDAPLFSSAVVTSTVADSFSSISFNGNSGNSNWANAWQELGEADGPTTGNVQVVSGVLTGYSLSIGSSSQSIAGDGASRLLYLSNAISARLKYTYKRTATTTNSTTNTGSVSAQVSADGGTSWTTLATYFINATDASAQSTTFDISPYMAANTVVRFIGAGSINGNFAVDDIQIGYVTPTNLPAAPEFSNVRDEFATASYAGNSGTAAWATNWVESETTTVNLPAQKDTYIANTSSVGQNYGACNQLGVANTTLGIIRRPLYSFDLSAIPASATIVSATLSLYTSYIDKAPTVVNAHRVTADWDEGTACATTGKANWNYRKSLTAWTAAGGDFDPVASTAVTVNSTSAGTYKFALTSLVQNWVSGTYPNYGLLLNRPVVAGAGEISWLSHEDPNTALRPNLQVTYKDSSTGNIRVVTGANCEAGAGNCMAVSNTNVGDNVSRSANLSNATAATLSFWRNNQLVGLNNNDSIVLEASPNGTSSWTTLRTWKDIAADMGSAYESFDLTPYISATTSIRFRAATHTDNGTLYLESIQIQYTKLQNTYNSATGVDKLWKEAPYLDGQGVSVAVVDSGIYNNADFQVYTASDSRILTATTVISGSTDASDGYGHGTFVAGIIAGNGKGTNGARAGIAPGANLISVKVSNASGMSYASDLVHGLQWVSENRAAYNIKVVNISLNSAVTETYKTSPLSAAVEMLWFNGIVVVVSAGNNGNVSGPVSLYPPANDPFVITVGAADDQATPAISDDAVSAFSAYGTTEDGFAKPDLVAPGRNIISLLAGTTSNVYVNHPANRVDTVVFRMSGTSMSAPMVSGAAALLLQDQPEMNPDQVKNRLLTTASKNWNYDPVKAGAGYLDAYAAVHGTSMQPGNLGLVPNDQLAKMALIAYWVTNNGGTALDLSTVNWNSVNWNSVNWNSVNWNSVNWNSVNWNSVNWNSVNWNSVNWNSVNWNSVNWNSVNWNSVNWNSVNWNSVNWNTDYWGK